MNTIWQTLAWKEWRESRWKLLAVLGTLFLSMAVLGSSLKELDFSSIQIAILLPIIPISVVIATTVAAHERSQGTLPFLAALPVSQRKVAVAKLAAGLATCLIPVLVVLALLFAWRMSWDSLGIDFKTSMRVAATEWRGPFNFSNWFVATGCVVTFWVVSLFLWTAAAGVRRADEVSAGAMALALIAGVWLALFAIAYSLAGDEIPAFLDSHPSLVAFASAIAPGGFPHLRPLNFSQGWTALCVVGVFLAVQAGMAAWFVTRFGGNPSPRIKSNRSALIDSSRLDWLAPPRRSPLTAIVWKQFRESGPLALAGLGGVAMIVVAGIVVTLRSQNGFTETKDVAAVSAFFGSIYLGALTTMVIGVGVFLRDLEAGIHTFWRSRPVEPNTWFWVKFLTGLAIVALTFLLPMLIAPNFVSENQFRAPDGRSEIPWLQMTAAATWVAAYSIAVATTCLSRSAVIATLLTMAGLYLASLTPTLVVFAFRWLTSPIRPKHPFETGESPTLIITGLLLAACISTIVGWLAVRNDWGRRSGH